MILIATLSMVDVLIYAEASEEHGMLHQHDGMGGNGLANDWEGSVEGKAYSERNHHLAGLFVIFIGLSELGQGLMPSISPWTRFVLPVFMLFASAFLLVWSDHEAWPIGSMTVMQTFWGNDPEILQHKIYGLLLLAVACTEFLRRGGRIRHTLWILPLPVFAIIGGLMLFLHSHGSHPSAHKIAIHHTIMGTMAVSAGCSKLLSGSTRPYVHSMAWFNRLQWEVIWAFCILFIGIQLLLYTE
jgi:putative copper resistance protein D